MKPNKENIITAILEELGKNTTYRVCLAVIGSKFGTPETSFARYWKIAQERHSLTQQEAQQAINDEVVATAVEMAKTGLKSRMEYCLEIQKQLDDNTQKESVLNILTGKVTHYYRDLTPLERKALYERISKFEGMDAPVKSADTYVDGTDKLNYIELENGTKIPI